MASKQLPVQRIFDQRGRAILERRGLPRELGSTLKGDAYHFLRTASWTRITALMVALFLVVNLLFAIVLYATGAVVVGGHGFADDFWFSVQTVATIGYGALSPGDTIANVVVTLESFVGIALTALVTGVVFSRFATTTAKVLFSNVCIIGEHQGKRVLQFRMANARATAIVEATAHVYLTRTIVYPNGETMRVIEDLPLRRAVTPIFSFSWSAFHDIDEKSPLHDVGRDSIGDANIIVTFQGIDDRLAATVHTRAVYQPSDIVFDRKFVDIIRVDKETGARYLDFEPFHDHVPA